MRVPLTGRHAFADDEIDVIVNSDQRADAAGSAAADDVSFGEHALCRGDRDIAAEGIVGAVDGQEVNRSRHGEIPAKSWEFVFNVVSEATERDPI